MVSKNLPMSIKNLVPVKYWWFDGYLKLRESLYTQVIKWVNTILHHIDIRTTIPRYKDNSMVYDPQWYWNIKDTIKTPTPYWYKTKAKSSFYIPIWYQKKIIQGHHWLEQRTFYICSLMVKLILACQDMLKRVWPSAEQTWLLFIQTQTLPLSIHHRWKKIYWFVCKTTNWNHKRQTSYKNSHWVEG